MRNIVISAAAHSRNSMIYKTIALLYYRGTGFASLESSILADCRQETPNGYTLESPTRFRSPEFRQDTSAAGMDKKPVCHDPRIQEPMARVL
jgi:hypothetical protein